jgi:hypothetical protein
MAAVITLPEGTYTVRIRDAGNHIVAGSERELVSFGALDKGVGYVLRPADRWTRPVVSLAPDEAIYTTGRADLFFQPVPVLKFEARRFTRLFQPQSVEAADASQTVWVPQKEAKGPAPDFALALWDGNTLVDTLPLTPYRVSQIPGVSRGYVIDVFAPQEGDPLQPDFYAMRIGQESAATRVSLLHGAGRDPVGTSERRIKRVRPLAEAWLFLPALLPLALGVALRAGSRTRRRARGISRPAAE